MFDRSDVLLQIHLDGREEQKFINKYTLSRASSSTGDKCDRNAGAVLSVI